MSGKRNESHNHDLVDDDHKMVRSAFLCVIVVITLTLFSGSSWLHASEKNPLDGMSATDIIVRAAVAQAKADQAAVDQAAGEPVEPNVPTGACVDSVDEATSIEFSKFQFAKLAGRAGHEFLSPVDSQPLPGSAEVIAELLGPWSTTEFRLVTQTGELISIITMQAADDESARMYWAGAVDVPNEAFRVAVSGTDDGGTPFDLTCSHLFKPQTVSVVFEANLQHASPGQLELNAVVTNYGPADSFDLEFSNDMGLPVFGSPTLVTLSQDEAADVTLTLDVPQISTGFLDVKAKVAAKGITNSAVENYGTTLVRLERFEYIFSDGFDVNDSEETP